MIRRSAEKATLSKLVGFRLEGRPYLLDQAQGSTGKDHNHPEVAVFV
jgi:hypothetical protein